MLPEREVVYALQTELDRAIDRYKDKLKCKQKIKDESPERWNKFIQSERNKITTVASIQMGLLKYRNQIAAMSVDDREDEVHNSTRLGENMRADGIAKPGAYWEAHAMISGGHTDASFLRSVLAECEVGIDDSHNGCWLPTRTKYCGQQPYPKAVPHSRIHRFNYYRWLAVRFTGIQDKTTMINRLKNVRRDLLNSSFPPEVMLAKGKWSTPYDNV